MVAPTAIMGHAHGPHDSRPGTGKDYRGSRKRLREITMKGNWSIEMWLLVIAALIILFVLVPWLVTHPITHRD
jgi:hypothetical protein